MKKFLIMFGLVVSLLGCSFTPLYASELEKHKTISEIGILANSERYTEALEKCEAALVKYPEDPELYYWSATIKSSTGDKKSALADYDKVIELNPKDSNAYVMRGICKSDLNNPIGAIEDYNKALEINPKDSSAYSMRACAKLDLGDFNGANADLEVANQLYENIQHKK